MERTEQGVVRLPVEGGIQTEVRWALNIGSGLEREWRLDSVTSEDLGNSQVLQCQGYGASGAVLGAEFHTNELNTPWKGEQQNKNSFHSCHS